MSKKSDKKKKKVTYIDDGSTIADMSALGGGRTGGPRGTLKEQKNTFFRAMRMMFIPMLVAMGLISVAYLIVYLML